MRSVRAHPLHSTSRTHSSSLLTDSHCLPAHYSPSPAPLVSANPQLGVLVLCQAEEHAALFRDDCWSSARRLSRFHNLPPRCTILYHLVRGHEPDHSGEGDIQVLFEELTIPVTPEFEVRVYTVPRWFIFLEEHVRRMGEYYPRAARR